MSFYILGITKRICFRYPLVLVVKVVIVFLCFYYEIISFQLKEKHVKAPKNCIHVIAFGLPKPHVII